jgi:hypothetical protein
MAVGFHLRRSPPTAIRHSPRFNAISLSSRGIDVPHCGLDIYVNLHSRGGGRRLTAGAPFEIGIRGANEATSGFWLGRY